MNFISKMERGTKDSSAMADSKDWAHTPDWMELNLKENGTMALLLSKWTFTLMKNGRFVI